MQSYDIEFVVQDLVDEAFPPTIFALFVMTCVIEPILAATYKATKQFVNYKCRTIQRTKEKAEFRIMACIHSTRNIAGMINLLQVSNATNQSAIHVFAVHLVEHLGHSTAMLLTNDGSNSTGFNDSCPMQATEAEQFKKAFENYEKTSNNAVNVHTLTSVSPHESMHEDICCLAEDKRVAFIIIPYIRPLTTNDKIRNANTNRTVNLNLLQNMPCSVCTFVDRGLGSDEDKESQLKDHHGIQHLLMLFLGGPDDREALAYAWRMAAHPNVKLTVVRFLPGKDPRTVLHQKHNSEVARCTEKQADDEDIYEFKFKTMNDESISYIENVVNNGEEIVAAIKDLSDNCDLYIIGRREGAESRLTYDLSLDNSTNFPELGVIGSVLAMSNFSSHASVLVIQQYISRKTANKSESRKHDRMSIDHYCETIASQIIDDDYDDDDEEDDN